MAYTHDEDDDPEFPDPSDTDDADDENDVLDPCPNCKKLMYDDAEQCPYCGHYVTEETAPTSHAKWVTVTALICLVVAILMALG
ncbi:MAG TPA: hypothetical protein VF595_10280 [Tepidisphaeraceae bacterium]|jgi:uncharacterized paraquat-inducible protein A